MGLAGGVHASHADPGFRALRRADAGGDKATLWYCSANRDEEKFDNPWRFDVRRDPNPHAGFGGGGAHFCLGANLARREIAVAFDELRRQIPDITVTGEPDRLLSAFIHGIKHLPVAWTPRRPAGAVRG